VYHSSFFEGACVSKKRKTKNFDENDVKEQEEIETEDIYDDEQREKMLDEDEITAAENAFMQGREMKPKTIKKNKKTSHKDTVSVELAEEEYAED
jgi:hypothetical protein